MRATVRGEGFELAGEVGPGESWAAAAGRIAAPMCAVPVADDLSGEPLAFVVEPDLRTDLRAMTRGDLPILARWLAAPHVRRWWNTGDPPTPERVAATYGPRVDGATPTRMWVAEVNGRSIGFVHDYRIREHPEFALLTPNPDAIGLDYAIGEPEWVGRGLGARVLWTWMIGAARRFPDAREFFAAPDHRNTASLRILDKVGFTRGTWFDEPTSDGTVATVVGCTLDVRRVVGGAPGAEPGPPTGGP
jgi:aminoglycoside 6'-N-acetyltransferase